MSEYTAGSNVMRGGHTLLKRKYYVNADQRTDFWYRLTMVVLLSNGDEYGASMNNVKGMDAKHDVVNLW